nr:hypothetical protein [Alphaproteobacteria bacterium]
MAEWLSISEIVTHNIDGLPRSERGLRRWLNQRNIASRPRAGQGGGNEFNMALMPIKYRIKLSMLRRTQQPVLNNSGGDINNMGGFATCASAGLSVGHQPRDDAPHAPHRVNKNAGECLNTPPAVLNKNDGENHNAPHNIKNKTLLQTRLDLLDRIEQYATVNNMPYKIAVEEVLNARELVGIAPNPSLPTILRWKRWRACNDLQSLSGGNWGNRKDTGKINPDSEVEKILI